MRKVPMLTSKIRALKIKIGKIIQVKTGESQKVIILLLFVTS